MSADHLTPITVDGFDHIVLVVADVARTCSFYERALGMRPVEDPPGRWALRFGRYKISLQPADNVPGLAKGTTVGSGNFCVLTRVSVWRVADHLKSMGVHIVEGPSPRTGATGPILSVYFHDPDGNLVEIANAVGTDAAPAS